MTQAHLARPVRIIPSVAFGATLQPQGGASFRLWAPGARQVELVLHGGPGDCAALKAVPATEADEHWYEVHRADAQAGQRYQWRIDGSLCVPDPASRFNPEGPHAPSELIDPNAYEWDRAERAWPGRPWHEAAFYQLHVGAFTPEGSYAAAALRLPELAALGITAVQLMPLADFPGRFGWGYDGVLPFAPFHGYGRPDELKAFVQAAHRLRLMVFGDVVYNHFGPDGNYLHAYAPAFFSQRHHTAWGAGINFDGEAADTVREFFIANALYWLEEFRFDGLRLDAVHAMRDDRRPDILQVLSARVRQQCAGRHVHLVLENDTNDPERLGAPAMPASAGRYEGQWNGDVHHALHVLLTDEHDGYYAEYDQPIAQLGRSLAHGFARQGGPHDAEGAAPRREAEGSAPLGAIVNLLQNHDQIGNRAFGERLLSLAEPQAVRLAAAIVCLAPSTPLLFMGEEFGATTPFLYFADWQGELREAVREGRRNEFSHFPRYAEAALDGRLPDPCSGESFEACRLDWPAAQSDEAQAWRRFYAMLLRLRAEHLWPWLPALKPEGHVAMHEGTLLQVRWLFARTPARTLQMRVNLSPCAARLETPSPFGGEGRGEGPGVAEAQRHDVDARRPSPQPAPMGRGSDALYSIGDTDGLRFGPWSGEWRWLPPCP